MAVRLLLASFIALCSSLVTSSAHADCKTSEFALNLPFLIEKMKGDLCWNQGASVIADLDNRVMFLCLEKKSVKAFPFAYGTDGFPKREEDDWKTPVGTYKLGAPRASGAGFGTFIPIGYPTPEQVARGLTGQDVGIHGPDRSEVCDGLKTVSTNWTAGCLALPSDLAVSSVAQFLKDHPAAPVHIYTRTKLR